MTYVSFLSNFETRADPTRESTQRHSGRSGTTTALAQSEVPSIFVAKREDDSGDSHERKIACFCCCCAKSREQSSLATMSQLLLEISCMQVIPSGSLLIACKDSAQTYCQDEDLWDDDGDAILGDACCCCAAPTPSVPAACGGPAAVNVLRPRGALGRLRVKF